MAEVIRVETKSGWYSKINWIAIIAAVASLATANVFGLEAETQVKVMGVVTMLQSVSTIIVKTFFTPTITPASASISGEKTMTLD